MIGNPHDLWPKSLWKFMPGTAKGLSPKRKKPEKGFREKSQ